MKLLIKKSTKPAHLGTVTFEIYTRLQVEPDELILLDKCNLLNEPMLAKQTEQKKDGTINTLFAMAESYSTKIYEVIEGYTYRCDRLDQLTELEEELKTTSLNLQQYLLNAMSFDQEEVIDLVETLNKEANKC